MRLLALDVDNYRNLSGLNFSLHPEMNFIIGDNNIGKSNVLSLLENLFAGRPFSNSDYLDKTKPIQISVTLKLEDFERGIFDDVCDPSESDTITLGVTQLPLDEHLSVVHTPTGTELSYRSLSRLNFISYSSTRSLEREFGFDKSRGISKFLSRILKVASERSTVTDQSVLNSSEATKLVCELQKLTDRIRVFSQFEITPGLIDGELGILSKIITLKDEGDVTISGQGHGTLFTAILTLAILERIASLVEKGSAIQTAVSGKPKVKLRSIMGLDEPEVHLHPFLQRSMVRYLQKICCDSDSEFQTFIKDLFQLDSFGAQIITATHSPNVFSENFRHIIRFFKKKDGTLSAVSGLKIKVTSQEEKHLNKTFPSLREALFSRVAIVVEGDTEIAALPLWFKKSGLDPDNFGISFIDARGKGSVAPLLSLLKQFEVPTFAVVDRDSGTNANPPFLEVTKGRDFEEDVISVLLGKPRTIQKILDEIGFGKAIVQKTKLNAISSKYGITASFQQDAGVADLKDLSDEHKRTFYLAVFETQKGILLGKIIGEQVEVLDIPSTYLELINKVKGLLKDARPYF